VKPFGLRAPALAEFIQLSKIRRDERLIGEESPPQKMFVMGVQPRARESASG
jgi:hypothetical protein